MAKVERDGDGTWLVRGDGGDVLASGLTNSQAWRKIDILNQDTLNKCQDTSDWSFKQRASGD